jgi:hypothetical protein
MAENTPPLPKIPRQLRAVFDLLSVDERTALQQPHAEKVLHLLYRILDTLDSKTSHLLSFNSILVAAQVFLASTKFQNRILPEWAQATLFMFVLVPLVSALFAIWVFRVEWPFLNWQKERERPITDRETVNSAMLREFVDLAAVCDKRYHAHVRVWKLTLASVLVLFVSVTGVVAWMWWPGS